MNVYISRKDTPDTLKVKHQIHLTRLKKIRVLNSLNPAWVLSEKIRHHEEYLRNKKKIIARSKLWAKTHPVQRKLIKQRYENRKKMYKQHNKSRLSRVSQCPKPLAQRARDNIFDLGSASRGIKI